MHGTLPHTPGQYTGTIPDDSPDGDANESPYTLKAFGSLKEQFKDTFPNGEEVLVGENGFHHDPYITARSGMPFTLFLSAHFMTAALRRVGKSNITPKENHDLLTQAFDQAKQNISTDDPDTLPHDNPDRAELEAVEELHISRLIPRA